MNSFGFLDFDLIRYPPPTSPSIAIQGAGHRKVLVVLHGPAAADEANIDFLENILKAAQLTPTTEQIYRLDLPKGVDFALAPCCRVLNIRDVLMFGDCRAQLGIRAQLPPYTFTRIGEVHYLLAQELDQLRAEREQGRKQHAGALWQALKNRYLAAS
ncbi:MAG: hypothetical protein D6772_10400 [Bacteroidetes bacterium]|nr:MAG: hypothetical protein D6772_10400 [Bacteroidota bacterium]